MGLANRPLAVFFAAALVSAVPSLAPPSVIAVDDLRLLDAMNERAAFGLDDDRQTVALLLNSERDVGTAEWGIPMTAEEELTLDLPGRMAYAEEAQREMLPFAMSTPTFGGAYFDQQNGGRLVILLTQMGGEGPGRDLLPSGTLPGDRISRRDAHVRSPRDRHGPRLGLSRCTRSRSPRLQRDP